MPMTYTPHDLELAQSFQLNIQNVSIMFQFPPKVTNDSRKGEWVEDKVPGSEPIAIIAKPDAHTYTITWVYIVDGSAWTAEVIHTQLRTLRGYWMYKDDDSLVVMVKFWKIGGPVETSARITDVDVKHGETIVGSGNEAFPLRSDVTVTIKLWHQTGMKNDPDIVQDVKKLNRTIPPEWY